MEKIAVRNLKNNHVPLLKNALIREISHFLYGIRFTKCDYGALLKPNSLSGEQRLLCT